MSDLRSCSCSTSNLIQRYPPGVDINSLQRQMSKYLEDPEMCQKIYDIHHNSSPRLMVLLRGPSGSGKSTLAGILWAISKKGVICSADNYFVTPEGQYQFNGAMLGQAHETCKAYCKEAMGEEKNPVIIDNTNMTMNEMLPYVEIALHWKYNIGIAMSSPSCTWNARFLARRNVHGVSENAIQRQLDKYEETSVPEMFGVIQESYELQLDAENFTDEI